MVLSERGTKRRVLLGFVSMVTLLAARGSATAVDFGAVDVSLIPLGGSSYDIIPRVALRVGTAPPAPVSLEYQVLVGGVSAATRTEPVNLATLCAGPGCSGACRVAVGGQTHDGICSLIFEDCNCVVSVAPLPAFHAVVIPPGSTCKLVLDPQGLVSETDETNNTFVVTAQPVPALTPLRMLLAALVMIPAAWFARRRFRRRIE